MDYSELSAEELIAECTGTEKADAWKEFVRRFQPLIASVVIRTARRYGQAWNTIVDDLIQETYVRLCTGEWKRLREFQRQGESTFHGFMKAVARTVTLDYFKSQHASKRGAGLRSSADFDVVLQMTPQKTAIEDQVLLREIDERLSQIAVTARDKWIFVLYYHHGLTTRAISEIPEIQLSQKGVESCLYRLTRQLQQDLAL